MKLYCSSTFDNHDGQACLKNKPRLLTERKFNQEKILVQHQSIINILKKIDQYYTILENTGIKQNYKNVCIGAQCHRRLCKQGLKKML